MSKYIITAKEEVCSKLARVLKKYPVVKDTFENSGFWYTNGETGPEWFTVTIEADFKDKDEIEMLLQQELKNMNATASNYYWG
ncbi:hypothetical protein [Pseudotenacibaculum haliotis]|uniref:Uncharacterized protein n=1 Tax=Pseudotenacibaculum haliotis TaxID=1862138 RepID=A0ABW5LS99_9FLAO